MGIKLQDLILSLSRDVNEAYRRLKKEKVGVKVPQVEVTINLEVELEGREEKEERISTSEHKALVGAKIRKLVIDERAFRERGLVFRSLKTTPNTKDFANFTIKIAFMPSEEDE